MLARCFILTVLLSLSCTPADHSQTTRTPGAKPIADANSLISLHLRLTLDPESGDVTYLGWYDGLRNLLGPGGIGAALIGMEPPELKGELKKLSDTEFQYTGIDQNQITWLKRYRLEASTVHVTLKITSHRDQSFEAIIYSRSDLPDATITGTPRDQEISSPIATAHFHADIDAKYFPGESMSPYILRSDTKNLNSGDSLEFHMTWELAPKTKS